MPHPWGTEIKTNPLPPVYAGGGMGLPLIAGCILSAGYTSETATDHWATTEVAGLYMLLTFKG